MLEFYRLKVRHFPWLLVVILLVLLTAAILLYWYQELSLKALVIWILGLAFIALFFVFGIRVARKDGFINGFRNGRDGIDDFPKEKP